MTPNCPGVDCVTVVIPTTGIRPSLLVSIQSALSQVATREVIVVYNGGNGDTEMLASAERLNRVTVIRRDDLKGPARARQTGIELAVSPWVAFLDDDDVWLAEKLNRQLDAAAPGVKLIISRAVWVFEQSSKVLPGRFPRKGECLADYNFVVGRFGKHGLVSPPTLLVAASFLKEVPWWPASSAAILERHEDEQWVVRASSRLSRNEWVVLPHVATAVTRGSASSLTDAAHASANTVAASEQAWLEIVDPWLSRQAARHFRLTHVWPHVEHLGKAAVSDALRAPWAALVGAWRRIRVRLH